MARPVLDNKTARAVFLHRHGLADQPSGPGKGADLQAVIEDLGFVQLDSINTVARAHDLILFARRPGYRPKNLQRLYEKDRGLFEHWTHDAAVIPMAFYPHWHLRFQRDADLLKSRWRNWRRDGFETRFDQVLAHIRDHGPVSSSDVGKDEQKSSGGWWDWHPSKTALEYLWRSGALTVVGRQGFQKRYDLTERVIDQALLQSNARPEARETIDWCCEAALDRLGFATSGELAAFWDTVSAAEAKEWCNIALRDGRIIEIDIACAGGATRRVFARPDLMDQIPDVPDPPGRIRVLSPFDPALRDRKRAERLFDFSYRIEIFVPEAKRTYGYYVFPLLERDRIIGRIDMKAFRDQDMLVVRKLWPERGVRWSAARTRRLEAELQRITRLAGVSEVRFEDDWLAEPL
ncbi:winged helix-turn-helix domain-containing protein [Aestuariivita boseongensis]|uniref:winged helix-turn-helix domain-containing protein n=1 Tax=Aestuariivita boseongensis TaxID=1470562 RepID=UPI00068081A6|nr:crosslink repair DNA glycosylase YcaQ family protein [Aestuariivita boseongensis]